MYFDPAPAQRTEMRGWVEIVLFGDGYAGLQMVEGGRLNLCALVRRRRLDGAEGAWDRLLPELLGESPHLARRLSGAVPCLDRPLAVTGLPYGYVHRAAEEDMASVYRVGDQMGVIPSLAGDGIAIALRSGRQAAADRLAGLSAAAYHRRLRGDLVRPVGLAGLVHRLCLSRHRGVAVAASRALPGVIGVLAAWTRSEDDSQVIGKRTLRLHKPPACRRTPSDGGHPSQQAGSGDLERHPGHSDRPLRLPAALPRAHRNDRRPRGAHLVDAIAPVRRARRQSRVVACASSFS